MLIAQITDAHVRADGKLAYGIVDTTAALEKAVATLNGLDPRPDLVVLTGDLTDFGRLEEYGKLRELLQPLKIPLYPLVGNHDDRFVYRKAFPEHASLFADGFVTYAVEDWPVRVLALDTVVPGHDHGDLCQRRLAWVAARLDEQPERPTIIAMHHPPFRSGIVHMDKIGLLNIEPLRGLIGSHSNVTRIICGHVHRVITVGFAGTIASTCPSVAHQVALNLRPDSSSQFVMEPPAYQLHQWSEGQDLCTHTAFIGEFKGPYPFFDDKGALID